MRCHEVAAEDFLGVEPNAFVNGKIAYGSIKQPMQRTYIQYFTTWVLLKRGYYHCLPSHVDIARMVLQKGVHPLSVWKGELKALMTNLTKPQFPSIAIFLQYL